MPMDDRLLMEDLKSSVGEDPFRQVFENAPESMLVLERDFTIIFSNIQLSNELGLTAEELSSLALDKIFTPDHGELKDLLVNGLIANAQVLLRGVAFAKDSSKFSCELNVGLWQAGTDLRYIATLRKTSSVQNQNESKNELMNLAEVKRTTSLASMGSHLVQELRSPLSTIIGFSELMMGHMRSQDLESSKLPLIVKSALYMQDVMRNLSSFVRSQHSEPMIDLDLNSILKSSLGLLKFKTNDLNLSVTYGPLSDSLHGDRFQLETIIQTLILNSLDAFATSQTDYKVIAIKTYRNDDRIFFDYEDNAGGIASELISQLFDPFASLSSSARGMGTGLSLVRYLVVRHKGLLHLTVKESIGVQILLSFPRSLDFDTIAYEPKSAVAFNIQRME